MVNICELRLCKMLTCDEMNQLGGLISKYNNWQKKTTSQKDHWSIRTHWQLG